MGMLPLRHVTSSFMQYACVFKWQIHSIKFNAISIPKGQLGNYQAVDILVGSIIIVSLVTYYYKEFIALKYGFLYLGKRGNLCRPLWNR